MMRRLAGSALVGVALLLAAGTLDVSPAHADPFNDVIELHVTMSGTDHFATPDVTVQINVDCPSGVCPASSAAPMPDLMLEHYSANLVPCRSQNPPPCSGNSVPINAALGTLTLRMQTNVVAAFA